MILIYYLLEDTVSTLQHETEQNQVQELKSTKCTITNSFFAAIAKQIGKKRLDIFCPNKNIDPHHFRPSAQDIIKISKSEFVIRSGGHIDEWAKNICKETFCISDAMQETYKTNNQHIWFTDVSVIYLTDYITTKLKALYPKEASKFQKRSDNIKKRLKEIFTPMDIDEIIISNESFSYMLIGNFTKFKEPYLIITRPNESLNRYEKNKKYLPYACMFLQNQSIPIPEELKKDCEKYNVKIITISENMPEKYQEDPLQWFEDIVDEIKYAISTNSKSYMGLSWKPWKTAKQC